MIEQLADSHGILLRRDAVLSGVDDNALHRAVKTQRIVRIRQGVYVVTPVWKAASRLDRYRLLIEGVRQLYDDSVALSHTSACIEYGGPNWGLDLRKVHLTHLSGRGERSGARVVHHRGIVRAGDITRQNARWITSPARTAMDTASIALANRDGTRRDASVAVLDYFQQRGLTTREELDAVFHGMWAWPDTLGLHATLHLSDGKAESVGETRFRMFCKRHGIPAPVAQYEVRHPSGHVAGRVDFAWPERKSMAEFDGVSKYLRLRRPGETLEETILREKRREDQLREITGWLMIRIIWNDLAHPQELAHRIHRLFAQAA